MKRAFTFPGQGSQAVGMGKMLAENFDTAKSVFSEVDEALSQNLSGLMFEGPEDELTLTENAQPALMAVSMAVMRTLEAQGVDLAKSATFVAGHSLGEYSALAAAGSLSIADTARLLKTRGQAMQKAVPVGEGAMAAILGLDLETAQEIAAKAAGDEVCAAANDNAPGQVVLSGSKDAIARAIDLAKEAGAKRALPLAVSAPFHCSLMQPAADVMAEALSAVDIKAPVVPLVANVIAEAVSDADAIRDLLVRQVTGAVRWRESVVWMTGQGIEEVVEVGSGKVLTGLAKRIDRGLSGRPVGDADSIAALVSDLT